mmetsp:Transcript_34491/g.51183  ORF Transcript_34491/g.51183 Transcript_34491/m.51183 type:complete len:88 (+) Transcript_34491:335-598(+)
MSRRLHRVAACYQVLSIATKDNNPRYIHASEETKTKKHVKESGNLLHCDYATSYMYPRERNTRSMYYGLSTPTQPPKSPRQQMYIQF